MILKVHLDGAASHDVGDEIWQESFVDAIHTEAETIASYVGSDLLQSSDQAQRNALRDRIVGEMAAALMSVGDRYRAPDGVLYSLIEESAVDGSWGGGRLTAMGNCTSEPIVEEVLRFEDLRSPRPEAAVLLFAGATEPKMRRLPGTATRSSCAMAIMGTRGLWRLGQEVSANSVLGLE